MAATTPTSAFAWLAVMVAPVLGHMFSPWIGFKGGKGVATGLVDAAYRSQQPLKGTYSAAGGEDGVVVVVVLVGACVVVVVVVGNSSIGPTFTTPFSPSMASLYTELPFISK